MALIIPKCNAEPETLNYTLQVYYDANDWVSNSDLIDRLSRKLIDAGIENEKKEPQSYTKKTQVLSYYGLIEWENPLSNQSRRRITEYGKRLYELRNQENKFGIQELLVHILNNKTFGRNVLGCDSDSDLEAPNIFIKSTLLLDGLTNKEFAYILGKMEIDKIEFADVLFDVFIKRKRGLSIMLDINAAKWADPKPILALADWGIFDVIKDGTSKLYQLNGELINNFGDELASLRIKNNDIREWEYSEVENDEDPQSREEPLQLIYFGAPGTGKSFVIDGIVSKENSVRTTFHPDSDYSTFVGCYKPVKKQILNDYANLSLNDFKAMADDINQKTGEKVNLTIDFVSKYAVRLSQIAEESEHIKSLNQLLIGLGFHNESYLCKVITKTIEDLKNNAEITYEFVPQAFTTAYVNAWKNIDNPYYLVIEEINRGNCAQIFGDIFQLLDRDSDTGYSSYKITPDKDLQDYLATALKDCDIDDDIKSGEKMQLPSNLNILATMNTSDQSLFPIDSAFKRRWDWKYIPIDYTDNGHYIACGSNKYKWIEFLDAVNKRIESVTQSEDKKMGGWFVKPNGKEISADKFVSKVVFYLWNDVFKDFGHDGNSIFKEDFNKFHKFFDNKGDV